ncbi:MAG: signal peptide peptidase SppA [Deltaproteobacteria bacterium]|nr:signal peptide peptidase SppA [Deltaproteobacteria bacterium]
MRALFDRLKIIIKTCWRILSFSRAVFANLLFVLLLVVLGASLLDYEKAPPATPAALLLKPVGVITEAAPINEPWHKILREELEELQQSALQDILDVVKSAAHDTGITLLVLDLSRTDELSLSQITTIGEALQKFRESGKKLIAIGSHFSQSHYLLACYADEIILNPIGGVELTGFARNRLYGRQALEKLKINFNFFRAGTYKSALEPFFRDNMSDAARQANQVWLDDLWQSAGNRIVSERHLLHEELNDYINNYDQHLAVNQGNAAQAALAAGLVDRLLSAPQWRRYLAGLAGSAEKDHDDFKQIDWRDYAQQIQKSYRKAPTFEKIALIVARGTITPGPQPDYRIGADTLSSLLRRARCDSAVKAVVIRLDSGGGSMTASEIIRQELLQLKESGKPVIISMGRLAASGAYWISADADEIWAEPTTLTGSIGVFGAWPTFEKSLDAIGIHNDGIGTSLWADSHNPTRPLLPAQARALQLEVNYGYQRFLEIVAGGRRLSLAEVEKIAEGRVWSGMQAKEIGLVDHLGSLADAVNAAAARVGLSAADAVYLQDEKSAADIISSLLKAQPESLLAFLPKSCRDLAGTIEQQASGFWTFPDPENIYVYSFLEDFMQ